MHFVLISGDEPLFKGRAHSDKETVGLCLFDLFDNLGLFMGFKIAVMVTDNLNVWVPVFQFFHRLFNDFRSGPQKIITVIFLTIFLYKLKHYLAGFKWFC